ncbi:MAG: hypothetical protein ACK2U9_11360 [Anaerolineae bacterium]
MSAEASVGDLRPQFRLRPGQDDQLIAWLLSFAPRQRSQAIRRALRAYLRGDVRRPAEQAGTREEDPDLAAALDSLF